MYKLEKEISSIIFWGHVLFGVPAPGPFEVAP